MGAPFLDAKDPLQGMIGEIISAMSSLNMWPEACEPDPALDPDSHERKYLSQTDKWAKHAMEHLRAALEYTRKIQCS